MPDTQRLRIIIELQRDGWWAWAEQDFLPTDSHGPFVTAAAGLSAVTRELGRGEAGLARAEARDA